MRLMHQTMHGTTLPLAVWRGLKLMKKLTTTSVCRARDGFARILHDR